VHVPLAPVQLGEPSPMSIELKHLRYAEVAERCGSFRKAADLLALKQSHLSRRVRHLEEQLGVELFERTNGGVRPTAAGRDFVNGVRRVLNDLQTIVDGAKAVRRGEAGYLTIGFYTSLSAGNLRASLVEYSRRFPRVEISTVEGSRSRLGGNSVVAAACDKLQQLSDISIRHLGGSHHDPAALSSRCTRTPLHARHPPRCEAPPSRSVWHTGTA
jgi:DNA-binding transcriptional LysR family regulator